MFTILNTYPIICPQIVFKDRFNNQNAFTETNPAIWYDGNKWTVLVRGVNYRKFYNGTFTMYHNPSHSLYWIGEGSDLNSLEFKELKFEYGNLKWYPTYWNGVEDIRFIDKNTVLACVPQLNPGGAPALFKAILNREDSLLQNFEPLYPNSRPEKNWLPFMESLVLYSCSPLVVKNLETDSKREIICDENVNEDLKGYHGSTNGVLVDSQWYFLIHKNNVQGRTVHRWLVLSNNYTFIKVSQPFTFFKHSYIEFPCGLVYIKKENTFYQGLENTRAFCSSINTEDSTHILADAPIFVRGPALAGPQPSVKPLENTELKDRVEKPIFYVSLGVNDDKAYIIQCEVAF